MQIRKIKNLSNGLFFSIIFLALTMTVAAQFRAAVQGTVTDSTGAIIIGAKVTLTNNETGRVQTTTSSDNGLYRFSGLAPGKYNLTVEQANFEKSTIENLDVAAEVTQGQDITLITAGVAATVTVNDESPALDTENANVQKTISTTEIRNLPQNGRDPFELIRLTPGVFGDAARGTGGTALNLPNSANPGGSNNGIFQSENVPQISAAGQRVSANNYQLDGVSINSLQYGGAAVITPNQESVKEIAVSSSAFSAEDGRNSGAQIRTVTQNGTNQFHGSAFFKYNAPNLNAYNKFNGIPGVNVSAPLRNEQRYKTFGGSFGGRIIKNKLFFFGSYEGLRNNSDNPYEAYIETSQYRQQVISLRPNGTTAKIFQTPGIEPRIISMLTRTCADIFGDNSPTNPRCRNVAGGLDLGSITGTRNVYLPLGDGVGNANIGGGFDGIPDIAYALLNNPTRQKAAQFNFRFDYNLNSTNQIAVSSYITRRNDISPDGGSQSRASSDVVDAPRPYVLTGIWISNYGSSTVNEFRTNFTRFKSDQVAASTDTNFGIPHVQVEGLPFNQIRFGRGRSETTPAIFSQNTLEIADAATRLIGSHAVKIGASFRREFNNNELSGGARPLYSFVGLFNLANDTPIFEAINADPSTGAPASAKRELRSNDISVFAQDDWKPRPNLTLNFGLRYEYFSPLTDKGDRLSNLQLGTGAQTLTAAKVVLVKSLTDPDRNNFGPRFGFAYTPKFSNLFGNGFAERLENKVVLRGGAGIYYNRTPNIVFGNAAGNPPYFARYNICCGTADSPFVGGQISYVLGSSNAPDSYPVNPVLASGINPATGLPNTGPVEIYGSERRVPNAEVYKYSLDLQYELPFQMVASIGYEGNQSRHLIRLVNQNFLYAANPGIFAAYFASPDVNASYNGMNLRLDRRFANNFQVTASYRFAKSIDTLSNEGPGAQTNQSYPIDLKEERGPSDYDVRHLFNLSGLVTSPFFKDTKKLSGKLLGGFELSGILTYHTGTPWTPLIGQGLRGGGGEFFGPIRPLAYFGGVNQDTSNSAFLRRNGYFPNNLILNPQGNSVDCNTGAGCSRYFSTVRNGDTFQSNLPGIGRNSFRGPNYFDIDMSIAKRFALPGFGVLGESPSLELKFNFFNLFNRLNLQPFGFAGDGTFVDRPNFGQVTGALAGRTGEFQARFRF